MLIDEFVFFVFCVLKIRLIICEGRDGIEILNGDVLIFLDMIRYRFLNVFNLFWFLEIYISGFVLFFYFFNCWEIDDMLFWWGM